MIYEKARNQSYNTNNCLMCSFLIDYTYMKASTRQFTAVYKKSGSWYSGWIEEIPGVNTQGKTLAETKENLKEALLLILETNRMLSKKSAGRSVITRENLSVFA